MSRILSDLVWAHGCKEFWLAGYSCEQLEGTRENFFEQFEVVLSKVQVSDVSLAWIRYFLSLFFLCFYFFYFLFYFFFFLFLSLTLLSRGNSGTLMLRSWGVSTNFSFNLQGHQSGLVPIIGGDLLSKNLVTWRHFHSGSSCYVDSIGASLETEWFQGEVYLRIRKTERGGERVMIQSLQVDLTLDVMIFPGTLGGKRAIAKFRRPLREVWMDENDGGA